MLWWSTHLNHSLIFLFGFMIALLLLLNGYAYNKKKLTLKSTIFCAFFLILLSCIEFHSRINLPFEFYNIEEINARFEDTGSDVVNTLSTIIQFVLGLLR